jgi:AraC-like DNA-binding protein
VTTILSTRDVPAERRADLVRELVWASIAEIDIEHGVPADALDVEVAIDSIGGIGFFAVRSTPVRIRPTPAPPPQVRDAPVFLGLRRRPATPAPGDARVPKPTALISVYDAATPSTVRFDGGIDEVFFRFPRRALALPDAALAELDGVTLDPDDPVTRFAADYLARLATQADLRVGKAAEAMAAPTTELVHALLAARLDGAWTTPLAREHLLQPRILDYLGRHLTEPDLTARRVAEAHHISVRYLYAVLQRTGIVLGEWVRARRLEGSRRELARPEARRSTIASVGRRWGFTDAATFSRAFKAQFGLSPTEWRNLPRPG